MQKREDSQSSITGSDFFYGYVVVTAAVVIFGVAFGVHYAFGIFFKPILSEFGWSRALTSGAFSISWLFQGVSSIIMGRMNDRYGPRVVLILSGSLVAGGYLLTTRITAAWQLYMFYGVLVGFGTGGIYVPLISTIARWFVARRSAMTGIAVAGIGIGTFFIPLVANQLISIYDWRTAYSILGIAVLIVIVLASLFLKKDPAQTGQFPDGHSEIGGDQRQKEDEGYSLKEAFYTRQFWLVCGFFFCFGFYTYAILVHISPHATDLGLSTTTAARFVAAIGMASIIGKVLLGNLGDRIGNRNIYIICFILVAASLLLTNRTKETWVLYLFVIAFGLAYGGCSASQSPLVATLFGLKSHGLIMGTVNNGATIGATIAPLLTGYLFDVTGSYQAAFLLVALIAVIGLALTIALKPKMSGE